MNNGVIVHLGDKARWTVTKDCWLTKLELGPDTVIDGADGASVRMTVDGRETAIRPGVYQGLIELRLS